MWARDVSEDKDNVSLSTRHIILHCLSSCTILSLFKVSPWEDEIGLSAPLSGPRTVPHLPQEKDIEWLWRETDREQIKPVVRGAGQEGQGGDEEDNISDGQLITTGS